MRSVLRVVAALTMVLSSAAAAPVWSGSAGAQTEEPEALEPCPGGGGIAVLGLSGAAITGAPDNAGTKVDLVVRSFGCGPVDVTARVGGLTERRHFDADANGNVDRTFSFAFALACAHTAISDPAHLDERLATATELIEVGQRAGNPELSLVGHVHRACDLLELARVDEARDEAGAAAQIVTELGQPMQRYFVIWLRSTLALLEGRFDDAEGLAQEALDIGLTRRWISDVPSKMV